MYRDNLGRQSYCMNLLLFIFPGDSHKWRNQCWGHVHNTVKAQEGAVTARWLSNLVFARASGLGPLWASHIRNEGPLRNGVPVLQVHHLGSGYGNWALYRLKPWGIVQHGWGWLERRRVEITTCCRVSGGLWTGSMAWSSWPQFFYESSGKGNECIAGKGNLKMAALCTK